MKAKMKFVFLVLLGTLALFALILKPDFSLRAQISDDSILTQIEGRTVSMDFKDASIKDVLKVFSQQSGLNFIASEAVQDRKLTLYLDKVPVKEAMDKILNANNLSYEREEDSNIFVVRDWGKPEIQTITRVYHLKYARVLASRMTREILNEMGGVSTIGTLTTVSATTGGGGSSTAGGGIGGIGTTGQEGITEAIKKILSDKGQITEDARTNSLVITDIPSRFPQIEAAISRLDVPTPQVMIETEMLDVNKKVADLMGVKYSGSFMTISGGSRTTQFPFLDPEFASGGPAKAFTLGTMNASAFTILLQFLTTDTDTKYLARPRIFTLSNETAEIRITTDEAVGTTTTTTGVTGAGTTTVGAERTVTGVLLRVTPQINVATNEITMFVEPSVAVSKTGGTFGSTTFKDPETRGTKSTLRIKDGETIVIGGLLRKDDSDVVTKLPVLGDIPLLGALFRHRNRSLDTRELIVFLTPHIIRDQMQPLAKVSGAKEMPEDFLLEREQATTAQGPRQEEIDRALKAYEQ